MKSRVRIEYRRSRCRALLAAAVIALSPAAGGQQSDFAFENADLRTVIQAVSEYTGRAFQIDPNLQGTVTFVAPAPVTEDVVYRALQAALEANGFLTVEADGFTRIVRADNARTQTGGIAAPGAASMGDMVARVVQVEHIMAERLVPVLRPLVPDYAHIAADSVSRSVILVDRAANVAALVEIIRSLDRPAQTGAADLIFLSNASAVDLAALLSTVHVSADPQNPNAAVVVTADPRTNALIVKAEATLRAQILALASELDVPLDTSGNTHVVYLKNADAENIATVLQATLREDAGETVTGNVVITADPDTNALIVTASKSDFITLERVIEQLDVRRLQVYVEALIAEVSTDSSLELGIQWQSAEGFQDSANEGFVGGTDFTVGSSITDVILNPLAAGAGLNLGYVDGTFTLPDGTVVNNLSVLARALESETDANVLSTPTLLTMDNEVAEIVVGQNVPFITGAYSQINQGTAVANPFQTIERRDVGLTLRIEPQITEGSAIKLRIFQEVSSVAQKGEAQDIVTNTRSLETTIVAENDRMLVLGGLIQDDVSLNEQRIPLLGQIPILGNLFRYRSASNRKTNLLIFLRPRIIRSFADMDEPTRRKYEYLNALGSDQSPGQSVSDRLLLDNWEVIRPSGTDRTVEP